MKHDPNPTLMMGDEMKRARDWNTVFDSILGADPALTPSGAKPVSRLGASRFDQGEKGEEQ